MVNAFEYFDDKNRERVQIVKEKLTEQKTNLESVRDIVKFVKRKMYNSEGLIRQNEESFPGGAGSISNHSPTRKNGSFSSRFPPMASNKRASMNNIS